MQSPYVAQVQLLRDRLDELPEATGVEVATIDSFQGREADAVIISMVWVKTVMKLYQSQITREDEIVPTEMNTHSLRSKHQIGCWKNQPKLISGP